MSEALNAARRVLTPEQPTGHQIDAMQLESRVMYSASPLAAALPAESIEPTPESLDLGAPMDQVADFAQPADTGLSDLVDATGRPILGDEFRFESEVLAIDEFVLPAEEDQAQTHELVFLDTAAEDHEQLLDDLMSNADESRKFDVVQLDVNRDGVEQISEALGQYDNLDAVHIVSHGTDGAVKLGNIWLSLDTVGGYAGQLVGWRDAFTEDVDLLFYGCDLAASEDGRTLIDSLGALCDCDVAASDDDTGHAIFGADWDLEYSIGHVETEVAFSLDVQASWGHLLNVSVDATSTGTVVSGNLTISHTTSGSDRLMLVGVSINGDDGDETVSSITYNGENLSLVGTRTEGQARVEIWSLVAPDLGTQNVEIVTTGTSVGVTAGVMTFTGVDQASPLGTFGSAGGESNDGSAAITSTIGELVFGAITVTQATDYDLVPGAGQTETWDVFTNEANGGGSTEAGAASVDISWLWGDTKKYAIGGVSIKPAPAPAIGQTFYLDGIGDGSDVPTATFKSTAPTDPILDNFDPGRDGFAGLLIAKGGADVNESDPTKQQAWIVSSGNTVLDGSASLTLWTAMKDFDTVKAGTVTAYLVDSDATASSVTEIASATISRADWDVTDSGTWIEDTFDFGNVSYSLASGRFLGVKIIVDGASTDDMWFAYDATSYQSRLEFATSSGHPVVDLDADDSSTQSGSDFAATFVEAGGPVSIVDSDGTIMDPNSTDLNSLTVTITNLLDGTNEVLAANTLGTSITAIYDSATGVLSLTGTDTAANYQQVLRTITYDNTAAGPNTTARTITFVASDGLLVGSTATTTLAITPVNDVPTLSSFAAVIDTTNEDTEVELTLAELKAQGDEADMDGTVDAFGVKSVTRGTL